MSSRLKFTTELIGIVQRAVVNEGNFPRAIKVGVGIFVRLSSVSCPTSVRDANVMTFGSDRALFDKLKSIRVFSDRRILSNSLYTWSIGYDVNNFQRRQKTKLI